MNERKILENKGDEKQRPTDDNYCKTDEIKNENTLLIKRKKIFLQIFLQVKTKQLKDIG